MDSLSSMEFRNQLVKTLGCALPATVAFDYPTLEDLARHLRERVMPERFSAGEDTAKAQNGGRDLNDLELAQLLARAMDD